MNSLQVTFRDIPYSYALENNIEEHADKLGEYIKRFIHCRVVLTISQNHKHQGKLYNVRIDLAVPGADIAVTRQLNEDIYVAIRDAFDALLRRIEDYSDKRQGEVKTHSIPVHGRILRIFYDDGFGFIAGQDGNEYYFSVTNLASKRFEQLRIGDNVRFLAQTNAEGLQAHRIIKERSHNSLNHHNHVDIDTK